MVSSPDKAAAKSSEGTNSGESTTVYLSEVVANGLRLEASAYDADARRAVASVVSYKSGSTPLWGEGSLARFVAQPFRMKRKYVEQEFGVPLLSSSSIIDLDQTPIGYISAKLTENLVDIRVKSYDVLISRSGTIGNVGIAGPRQVDWACTEDALRVRFSTPQIAGFAAAFLRTIYGRLQLTRSTYGSVVQHIEPEHLTHVRVPKFDESFISKIGDKFIQAVDKRDLAIDKLGVARALIEKLVSIRPKTATALYSAVNASTLRNRFEATFHAPSVLGVEAEIAKSPVRFKPLADKEIGLEAKAVTKFRKRVYVAKSEIPLYSSKSVFQIDPIEAKYLGPGVHSKDLPEIGLTPGMVLVTCSGTIGRVFHVPNYMDGWAVNQHALRLFSDDPVTNSVCYAWLSSAVGQKLIQRLAYGSVIQEIDRWMVGEISFPILDKSARLQIHNLVSEASRLRTEAWLLEREAIDEIELELESH